MSYPAKYLIWLNPDSSRRPLGSPVKVRETVGGQLLTEGYMRFRDVEDMRGSATSSPGSGTTLTFVGSLSP